MLRTIDHTNGKNMLFVRQHVPYTINIRLFLLQLANNAMYIHKNNKGYPGIVLHNTGG